MNPNHKDNELKNKYLLKEIIMEINHDIIKLLEENCSMFKNKHILLKEFVCSEINKKFNITDQNIYMIIKFYAYLNYHIKNDFVVDLNQVCKWFEIEYEDAKKDIYKSFWKDVNFLDNEKGILLNVITFFKFCIKSSTLKSAEIRDYIYDLNNIYTQSRLKEIEILRTIHGL